MTPRACPICRKPADPSVASNPAFPFCSERCRLIDLGNWLGGTYRVAARSPDEPDDDAVSDDNGHENEDAT